MSLLSLRADARAVRLTGTRGVAFAALLALAPPLNAQLVDVCISADQTTLHSAPQVVDTVVWSFYFSQNQLTTVHVRLTTPGVTLERQHPGDWLYLWALPSWSFHTDPDFLGWHAEFDGETDPWGPPRLNAHFGIEFEPNPLLRDALLNAEVSYELGPPFEVLRPVPEPAGWGGFGALCLGVVIWLRQRPRVRPAWNSVH